MQPINITGADVKWNVRCQKLVYYLSFKHKINSLWLGAKAFNPLTRHVSLYTWSKSIKGCMTRPRTVILWLTIQPTSCLLSTPHSTSHKCIERKSYGLPTVSPTLFPHTFFIILTVTEIFCIVFEPPPLHTRIWIINELYLLVRIAKV